MEFPFSATSSGLGFDTLLIALSNQNVFADRVSADLDLALNLSHSGERPVAAGNPFSMFRFRPFYATSPGGSRMLGPF